MASRAVLVLVVSLAAAFTGSASAFGAPPLSGMVPSVPALDFGEIDMHQQQQQTIFFTNTSGVPIQGFDASVTGPDQAYFYTVSGQDSCSGWTIAPGFSCKVEVGFNPQQQTPLRNAMLHLDDTSGSIDVPLSGSAVSGTYPRTRPRWTSAASRCRAATATGRGSSRSR